MEIILSGALFFSIWLNVYLYIEAENNRKSALGYAERLLEALTKKDEEV